MRNNLAGSEEHLPPQCRDVTFAKSESYSVLSAQEALCSEKTNKSMIIVRYVALDVSLMLQEFFFFFFGIRAKRWYPPNNNSHRFHFLHTLSSPPRLRSTEACSALHSLCFLLDCPGLRRRTTSEGFLGQPAGEKYIKYKYRVEPRFTNTRGIEWS